MTMRYLKLNRAVSALLLTSAIAVAGPAFAEGHAKSESVDWSGTYIGVHAGVMLGRSTPLEYLGVWDVGEYSKAEAAVLAGIQAGIARQMGQFVYGVEVDFAATTFDARQSWRGTYSHEADWNWLATLRGRAGLTLGDGQIYVTGGLAVVDVDYNFVNTAGGAVSENGTRPGLAVGGGYEYALNDSWSLGFEYLYVGLPTDDVPNFGGDTGGFVSSAHIAKFALNYRMGGFETVTETSSAEAGDWSGFYVGANAGAMLGQTASLEYDGPHDFSEYSIERIAANGGFTIGFNWQDGHSLYGVEADINATSFDAKHNFRIPNALNAGAWDWYSTIRGKAGLVAGNAYGYVSTGLAIVKPDYVFSDALPTINVSSDSTQLGVVVGAGVEVALSDRLSAKAEYLFIGLEEEEIPNFGSDFGTFNSHAHIARFGLNYALGEGRLIGTSGSAPDTIDWGGFYGGVMVGSVIASSATTDYDNAVSDFGEYTIGEMAYTGGLVAGFNRQMGNMVYGLEADFSATSFDETHRFRASRENRHAMNWLATFRGRVGMAAGSSLLYATGGLAVANMDYVFRNTTALPGADHNETRLGFAAGFGFEHDLGNSWAIRTEAMHVALPTFTDTTTDAGGNPLDFTTSANIARASLIKRF